MFTFHWSLGITFKKVFKCCMSTFYFISENPYGEKTTFVRFGCTNRCFSNSDWLGTKTYDHSKRFFFWNTIAVLRQNAWWPPKSFFLKILNTFYLYEEPNKLSTIFCNPTKFHEQILITKTVIQV